MRTSTLSNFLQGVRAMQRLQSDLSNTQLQVTSGRRILKASDDPLGAAATLGFRESLARLAQFDRNANLAKTRLEYEETALSSVTNSLQRIRELTLQALNSTETPESRAQIGLEMSERVTELVQIANQKDGKGRYLFAGSVDGTEPVSVTNNSFVYNGDDGKRLIQIGDARQIYDGDAGSDVFFNIRNGNGVFRVDADTANTGTGIVKTTALLDSSLYDQAPYTVRFVAPDTYEVLDASNAVVSTGPYTSGEAIQFRGISVTIEGGAEAGDEFAVEPSGFQSAFETVSRMANALEARPAGSVGNAQLITTLNNGLQELDLALDRIGSVRTEIGIRLNAIESQVDSNGGAALLTEQAISEIEDLDYAEALSRLSQQSAILEASQQSFVLTQRLSLFQFL